MPLIIDANDVPWLEPKHIDLRLLAADLDKLGLDVVAQKYQLTGEEWRLVANGLGALYQRGAVNLANTASLNAAVNRVLAPNALCFPQLGTAGELAKMDALLKAVPPDIAAAQKLIFEIVMDPRLRSLQLVGRFMKLPPFDEFAYLVDAAALSFYRGNIPSAFITIIPVVEGVLLRWQGYKGGANKPTFPMMIQFLKDTSVRQHLPSLPLFFDSWLETTVRIVDTHLYRHTKTGPAIDHFNRHLALHLLEDQKFATRENIMRAFLLVDLLSDLYICEKRILDPRFSTKLEEENPHTLAYRQALASQGEAGHPERILAIHARCQ
jgi:hypothetical protein